MHGLLPSVDNQVPLFSTLYFGNMFPHSTSTNLHCAWRFCSSKTPPIPDCQPRWSLGQSIFSMPRPTQLASKKVVPYEAYFGSSPPSKSRCTTAHSHKLSISLLLLSNCRLPRSSFERSRDLFSIFLNRRISTNARQAAVYFFCWTVSGKHVVLFPAPTSCSNLLQPAAHSCGYHPSSHSELRRPLQVYNRSLFPFLWPGTNDRFPRLHASLASQRLSTIRTHACAVRSLPHLKQWFS